MQGGSTEPAGKAVKGKRKGAKFLILLVIFLLVGAAAVWHFGTQQPHQPKTHQLYSSFDQSPPHKKLLSQLEKSKLSVLVGQKEEGLLHFVLHLANRLSQKGPVFIEDIDHELFQYYQYAKDAKNQLEQAIQQVLTQPPATADWILLTHNSTIPADFLNKVISRRGNGRVLVVSSVGHKLKGFKNFEFPKVDEKVLESIIAKQLQLKPQVADILLDYFGSPHAAFDNLEDKFDHKAELGENLKPLDGLTKQDKASLEALCAKGVAKSKKESGKLYELGVIFHQGNNYWQNHQNILNYELAAGVNCKNTVATESVIQQAEQRRTEQAKKEEQRKAEEERKAAEAKAKEQALKVENQRKKQEAEAKKNKQAKPEKAPKAEKAAKAAKVPKKK